MHYYQFHLGDYIKATAHLSNEEDLAYRRLLDMYYDTEQKIPTDIPWVSRRLRVSEKVIENVLNDFFVSTPEGWLNHRAEQEIRDFHGFLHKQRLNGKQGGRPKKTHGLPTANPGLTQPKPKKSLTNSQLPITILLKNVQKSEDDQSQSPKDTFSEFWKAYPRKVGKGQAEKAWGKVKRPAETLRAILEAIGWQRTSEQWTKDGGQYIPNPSTYLNQRRWEDEKPTDGMPVDPDSKAAIELKGVTLGVGTWDGMKEPWRAYKSRVLKKEKNT